jgi:hypothetical protein
VTGRGRTCAAPRFKRALYRLSYGHVNGRSRARTGGLILIREALCQLSYPPSTPPRSRARPAPAGELDAHAAALDTALVTYRTLVVLPTNLSTPLAYPSTLDRRRAASYVEGCWSPMLTWCHCKLGARK